MQLPAGAGWHFQVFLNGVPQQEGRDFRREGNELVFEQQLAQEGRLGFWRWLSLFLGVAGPALGAEEKAKAEVPADSPKFAPVVNGKDYFIPLIWIWKSLLNRH